VTSFPAAGRVKEAAVLEAEKLKDMVRKDLSRNLAHYSTAAIAEKSMREIRAV
jgi:hypothetical protein